MSDVGEHRNLTWSHEEPIDRARAIPIHWYTDERIASLEQSAVFESAWHYAGRATQVEAPGQFFTTSLGQYQPTGRVLVLRDEQGTMRAFWNICRHRSATVACASEGTATRLRCPYHGWTYDLAGRLRGAPEFHEGEGFRRDDFGLVPLEVRQWGPFVFVHAPARDGLTRRAAESHSLNPVSELSPLAARSPLAASGQPEGSARRLMKQTLEKVMSPLEPHARELGQFQWYRRQDYRVEANWKVYVDNYLDGGYHVNSVHPGLGGVLDYARYRIELHDHAVLQTSPLKRQDRNDLTPTAAVRAGDAAYYWWLYPNFMINITGDVMDTNLVLADGPNACWVRIDYYFSPGAASGRDFRDQSIAIAEQIQEEDAAICAQVQRNLSTNLIPPGPFAPKRETGGYLFHRLIRRSLTIASTANEDNVARTMF